MWAGHEGQIQTSVTLCLHDSNGFGHKTIWSSKKYQNYHIFTPTISTETAFDGPSSKGVNWFSLS